GKLAASSCPVSRSGGKHAFCEVLVRKVRYPAPIGLPVLLGNRLVDNVVHDVVGGKKLTGSRILLELVENGTQIGGIVQAHAVRLVEAILPSPGISLALVAETVGFEIDHAEGRLVVGEHLERWI